MHRHQGYTHPTPQPRRQRPQQRSPPPTRGTQPWTPAPAGPTGPVDQGWAAAQAVVPADPGAHAWNSPDQSSGSQFLATHFGQRQGPVADPQAALAAIAQIAAPAQVAAATPAQEPQPTAAATQATTSAPAAPATASTQPTAVSTQPPVAGGKGPGPRAGGGRAPRGRPGQRDRRCPFCGGAHGARLCTARVSPGVCARCGLKGHKAAACTVPWCPDCNRCFDHRGGKCLQNLKPVPTPCTHAGCGSKTHTTEQCRKKRLNF